MDGPMQRAWAKLLRSSEFSKEDKRDAEELGAYPGYELYYPEGRAAIDAFNKAGGPSVGAAQPAIGSPPKGTRDENYFAAYRQALNAFQMQREAALKQLAEQQMLERAFAEVPKDKGAK